MLASIRNGSSAKLMANRPNISQRDFRCADKVISNIFPIGLLAKE
ncbi:hypothetical protein [Thiobacillus sp.]|nr:hypothetical protein [Thiobacillus sp.]